ncbi:hypothetical protein D9613_011926 [Agrocybe pediades]|uniref:Uncharacterized protein n=1 Tax=Agrocybe pediades TaxID=84607 RepID=A0A8H4QEL8_9AGAR|nr:hypothetical protein D9613_011926 [Agrocybe pediades]
MLFSGRVVEGTNSCRGRAAMYAAPDSWMEVVQILPVFSHDARVDARNRYHHNSNSIEHKGEASQKSTDRRDYTLLA